MALGSRESLKPASSALERDQQAAFGEALENLGKEVGRNAQLSGDFLAQDRCLPLNREKYRCLQSVLACLGQYQGLLRG